ncbi:hypothetical protein Salat_2504200 [Sesamum alatum]|uniref:Uncharacterized protein n=1 Tax=Sesamum alatum TaxID=300844 RepID=A0AAE1XSI8_9LAMI|nr:hypothetical protein Salat_2504200 [Sesamum alatum]
MEGKEVSECPRCLQLSGKVIPLVLFGMVNIVTVWDVLLGWRMSRDSQRVTMTLLWLLYYVMMSLAVLSLIAFADNKPADTVKPRDAKNTPSSDLEEPLVQPQSARP